MVHACWHEPSLEVLADYATDGVLHEDAWVAANTKGHELFTAVEVLCKGWEVRLPDGYAFLDKSGHPRTEIRTRWWHQQNPHYRELAIGVDDINKLPDAEIPGQAMPGYDNQKPLFIGHYWMHGTPCVQTDHIACVDWSAGKEGPLVGYRLNGNPLRNTQFFTS